MMDAAGLYALADSVGRLNAPNGVFADDGGDDA